MWGYLRKHSKTEQRQYAGRFGVSVVGEGGEYETLVLDAPFFREKRIELVEVERVWEGQSGYLKIKKARLVDK